MGFERLLVSGKAHVWFDQKPDQTFSARDDSGASFQPSWFSEFQRAWQPDLQHGRAWVARGAANGTTPLRILGYDPARPGGFNALYAGSPFAQAAQMELLRTAIVREKLGTGSSDTIAVVLSSLGRLGQEVGGASPLIDDLTMALDAEIALLLELIDARQTPAQVVFTAAHGAPDYPQNDRRVHAEALVTAIETALAAAFPQTISGTHLVEAYVYPFLYLRHERFKTADLPRAREVAATAAVATGFVRSWYTADRACSETGEWATRLANSFHQGRSGDAMLIYEPDCVEYEGMDRGVSYGSPYNYDAQVPLFLWGSPYVAGRFDRTIDMIDIAPTLATVAGTTMPPLSTGRVLAEAFGEGAEIG